MSTGEEEKPNGEASTVPTPSVAPSIAPAASSSSPAVQVVNVNSELKLIQPIPAPQPPTHATISADTVFTGELLKQVREARNITLREIADRTRISVASLAALEAERFEDLPNARVYVRGFVRCLAVELGLDREAVSRTYLPRWQAWYEAQHVR